MKLIAHAAAVICFCSAPLVQAKNYVEAKALSGQLRPQGLTPRADSDGLNKVRGQVARILSAMEESEVNAGPGGQELLNTAYSMFRPDVGPVHRMAAVGALVAMWNEARSLGAFDERHQFTGKITQGAYAGQDVVFEHIVPLSLAPAFSKDVANVRIVSPGKKRAEGAKPTPREEAYVTTLKAVEREIAGMKSQAKIENGPKTNAVGQTLAEAGALWKEAMKRDGELALQKPSIILKGARIATPSNRNGDRWVVQAEVTNLSKHATEIELQGFIFGTTDKFRQTYVMGERKQKLQLRSGEVVKVTFETPLGEGAYKGRADDYEQLSKDERQRSRVYYRGLAFRATHAKGVAATWASDNSLLGLMDVENSKDLESLPKLYLDPKSWPKYTRPDAEN